jgi:hypothetical protein
MCVCVCVCVCVFVREDSDSVVESQYNKENEKIFVTFAQTERGKKEENDTCSLFGM